MLCSEVHARLAELGSNLDAELREHLSVCAACAALADGGSLPQLMHSDRAPAAGGADLDTIWGDTCKALAREDHWTRSFSHAPTSQRIAALLIVAVGMLGAILGLMPRPDVGVELGRGLGVSLAASIAVLIAAVWLGYRPIHRPPLPRGVYGGVVLSALAVAWLPTFVAPAVEQGVASDAPALTKAFGCFASGNILGAVLLVFVVLGLRGERRPAAIPLAVFMASGIFGITALNLSCPIVDTTHVALGHSMVLTLLVLLPPVLRLRARQRRLDSSRLE